MLWTGHLLAVGRMSDVGGGVVAIELEPYKGKCPEVDPTKLTALTALYHLPKTSD